MKFLKVILTAALSFWMMQSFAQMPLESLRNMFNGSLVSIECDYTTEIQQTQVVGRSEILVQGNMYAMKGNGLEIFCDGNTVWTIDAAAQEVVIEPCFPGECDYMANPALLLTDLDDVFTVSGSRSLGSGRMEYTLDSCVRCGISKAVLVLTQEGKIISADFSLEEGGDLKVNVSSMKKTEEKQMSFFSPDRKFNSDWIVTDLR